jgi:micrococcal nuclease
MYEYHATIRSIYDGDTMRADIDLGFGVVLTNQPLRLYGINAPEVTGEQRPLGLVSRDKLREMLLGKRVVIKTYRDSREKYGRYLATVMLGDVNVNDWLVENNLAETKTY